MLEKLTQLVAKSILSNELKLQKKVGYRLVFKNLPDDWIDGYALVDMTLTWHSYGLPIKGLNYFTVGSLKNGLSSRFLTNDDLYQAWLGGYIFQSKKPLYWHSDDYLKLAEADQEGWLRHYGNTTPDMDFGNLTKIDDMVLSGKKAQLFEWVGITQSDVGNANHSLILKVMSDGMAYMMNTLTPGLKLKGKNFIPKTTQTTYQELAISGYMILVNINSRTKAVLYVCMVGDNKPDHAVMKQLITKHIQLMPV
ncbi:MAG: hypothetical protein V4611_02615 [Patescibacteria group bacterium]